MLSRGQVVNRSPEGRALRISGIMTEITERKRAEEAIRQAEKSGSLSLMAAGIAHDFNNQFQSLLANLELAQRGVEASTREGRALARAVEVLRNAAQLSQKMLDFTGKSLRQTLRVEPLALLQEQEPELRRIAQAFPRAQFELHRPAILPTIEVDPGQVTQILRNLLVNGLEALQGQTGTVSLDATVCNLEPRDLEDAHWVERPGVGPHVCLQVVDTGMGMLPEVMAHAGDPFFSTKASGRGLGLAATRGILRSHGGGLWIFSEPGKGTTIRALFPVAEGTPASVPALSTELRLQDPRRTLLLVDDEEPLREVMAEAIRDVLGYPLLEAKDGVEGLEVFKAHQEEIALVLMDAKMPRMGGTEAFQLMKECRPDVKAILCSGFSEEFGLSTAQSFGFIGFLKKPFSLAALEEAIAQALKG
jgi:signal transduction histidine kinase/ActR/RegA family two-component response regulator